MIRQVMLFSLLLMGNLFNVGGDAPVITAENVDALESVLTIDFDNVPDEAGDIISGWLRVDPTGSRAVTVNRANDLLVWDLLDGTLMDVYRIPGADGTNANMMDIAWSVDGSAIHSLHTDGATYTVAAYTPDALRMITVPAGEDRPVRVWAGTDPAHTWVEVITTDPNETPYVYQLDLTTGELLTELPSAAEADRASQVRIGRMPAPLAVTSSVAGEVSLWDLEAGERLYRVQVDDMPTFGHINGAAGRRLAWRDNASETLYILDFETGENVSVAALAGTYVQALLLSSSADVILGVNLDLESVVVAWDTATGSRTDLGAYRDCNRTPDMVQLSEDGTTLVIGCDTGLDVWRVLPTGDAS